MSEASGQAVRDAVMRWLLDEGFEVRKLEALQGAKLVWGLDAFTPPPLRVNMKVFQPERPKDKVVIMLGVKVSPEHLAELSNLDRADRVRFSSRLLLRILSVCRTCGVAFQPNLVDFRAITVVKAIYLDRLDRTAFMEATLTLLNTFLTIIATFNEAFPRLTKGLVGEERRPSTHM